MRLIKEIILLLAVSLFSCQDENYKDLEDGMYADIQTSVGNILVQLEYKKVPITVGNFVSLAEGTNSKVTDSMQGKPFYDGLKFHRVISKFNGGNHDFMIQGGDPLGTGAGGPGYKFSIEIPRDSIDELLFKHNVPGVLSMANSGPNGNGSQFFITIVPYPSLDGKYTIFGYVLKGQEVVGSIKVGTVINKLNIVRIGREAKKFNAMEAFNVEFEKAETLKLKKETVTKEFITKMEDYKSKAKELSSGLKIYYVKKGTGPKPALESDILVHYRVNFTDGKLLDTNMKEVAQLYGIFDQRDDKQKRYEPFLSKYSMQAGLIQGFKEGLMEMKFGDRVVIFIPYHLAYGESGSRGVPPKTDLIFELEMYPAK